MFLKPRAALLPLWAIVGLQLVPGSAQIRAQAQTPVIAPASRAAAGTRADPADPKAQVPPAVYVSPLRTYRGFAEAQVAPWRESNELVRQRGGWRAYAREAHEPDAAPASAASQPAAAAEPAASGHPGHEMK